MFEPVKASEQIKKEYEDYIATTFALEDAQLRTQFRDQLTDFVSRGPYLEVNDVFKSGATINELIDQGVLSPLFRKLEEKKKGKGEKYKEQLPLDRQMYLHQEKAIRKIVNGENVIVSTGTGSGKTNCYLIPVINELLREKEAGTLSPGVRALFIFPMNALANDQMKNIRKLLMFYKDITFGAYTGATEYTEKEASKLYNSMLGNEAIPELKQPLENELIDRDSIKRNPPHILFTNYAMLEHLLLRPQDDVLFKNANFKFVILDEAHIYHGATGIETSMLLRRLRARISDREPNFILTSATLGTTDNSDADIIKFAKNLCDADFREGAVVKAERQEFDASGNYDSYPESLYQDLADESKMAADVLSEYSVPFDDTKGEQRLLYDFLLKSDLYYKFRKYSAPIMDVNSLCDILGVGMDTVKSFFSLCGRGEKDGKAIADFRYHFFIRALEGCYVAFSPGKKLFLTRKQIYEENGENYAVFEIAYCTDCGRIAIVGEREKNQLKQPRWPAEDNYDYFYMESDSAENLDDEEIDTDEKEVYLLCPHCGAIIPEKHIRHPNCECSKEDFLRVVKARRTKTMVRCGSCCNGNYKRFYVGNDAVTSVLATALYEELPETVYEYSVPESETTNIFFKTSPKKIQRKKSKQFLAFSDSRQEAAKFACDLDVYHKEFLRRRGICHVLGIKQVTNNSCISDLVEWLTAYFDNKCSFAESNDCEGHLTSKSERNAWIAVLNELARANSPTSLTSLGILQFSYRGNTPEIVKIISREYSVSEERARNLLDLLAFEIVSAGAIIPDSSTDINDNDREYIFYSGQQQYMTKEKDPSAKAAIHGWMPRTRNTETKVFYKTKKLYYVKTLLNISDDQKASEFLRQYFEYLTDSNHNNFAMISPAKDGKYVMPARNFSIKIPGSENATWYKCKKCGRVSPFRIDDHCCMLNCNGVVEKVDSQELARDNHFAKLYRSKNMDPLLILEHTAQLSRKSSSEYQEKFLKKEINALSCSTTFEVGVDIGDLETVFLRNVPPLSSNYAQRAGRAGRSLDAAAYVLTYARLNSHDLTFFKTPEKMINGIISVPLFKLDNEKIGRRHVYAIALSMFFSKHEEIYNLNNADRFLNEGGYKEFLAWLDKKPAELKRMLEKSITDVNNFQSRLGINNYSWLEDFSGENGIFTKLVSSYEYDCNLLWAEYNKAKEANKKSDYLQNRYKIFRKNEVIGFLAKGNILPRYGFPVDTVELSLQSNSNLSERLQLNRDLQIAIGEYAPSAEVIANGKMYTSRYIKKAFVSKSQSGWSTAFIGVCPECGTVNYSLTKDGVKCSSCKKEISQFDFEESIDPVDGFVAEKDPKDVPLTRPEKVYRTDDCYIGDDQAKTIDKYLYQIGEHIIQVESTTNDFMLVRSVSNFFVCPECGYSLRDEEVDNPWGKIYVEKLHDNYWGKRCGIKKLERKGLHHRFRTDVAKLTFDDKSLRDDKFYSVMYAMLYAIVDVLSIERSDISACKSGNSIIFYDAVPGGAGHSRRLVTEDGEILHQVFKGAYKRVSECNCEPSCYNCLRSYSNQKLHDRLDRRLAAEFLNDYLGEVKAVTIDEMTDA